jgi:N6-L-threonylcarbamoyladenine synthase
MSRHPEDSGFLTLGIDTSCDDTAAAVVRGTSEMLSNVVSSQAGLHQLFGGVVPELASRKHLERMGPVVEEALRRAGIGFRDLDAVAVTHGPGLIGSLLVGVSAAKAYAYSLGIPLIGVNHLEAHVYANVLAGVELRTPAVCLVASGGHTDIVLVERLGAYRILGWTRDDAAGEAFDKVARVLGLPQPGGPSIERAAGSGRPDAIDFPRARFEDSWDFSFSGLKTAVARLWAKVEEGSLQYRVEDVAASFQAAVVEVLADHTGGAAASVRARQLLLAGGVAANTMLRQEMRKRSEALGLPLHYPPLSLCTDNAAMVACAGRHLLLRGPASSLGLDTFSALPLGDHV